MSQFDMDITTEDANTGITVRAALNAALQALISNSSGATEPTTKYAFMWWYDTTAGVLKQRNSANDGWVIVDTAGGIATDTIADEAEITLDTAKAGRGWAMAGDNEEYIEFRFTAAGVVTVISNSANAINTDTDGFLCVYDAGTGIRIKNRLGATKTIRYIVNYS